MRERRENDLVEASAANGLLDRVHRVVPVGDGAGRGAAGGCLDEGQCCGELPLPVSMPALPIGLGQLGMFGRVGDEEMEPRGALARPCPDRMQQRRGRRRLVGHDEHVRMGLGGW